MSVGRSGRSVPGEDTAWQMAFKPHHDRVRTGNGQYETADQQFDLAGGAMLFFIVHARIPLSSISAETHSSTITMSSR